MVENHPDNVPDDAVAVLSDPFQPFEGPISAAAMPDFNMDSFASEYSEDQCILEITAETEDIYTQPIWHCKLCSVDVFVQSKLCDTSLPFVASTPATPDSSASLNSNCQSTPTTPASLTSLRFCTTSSPSTPSEIGKREGRE